MTVSQSLQVWKSSLKDREAGLEDRIFSGGKVKEVKGGNMDLYESLLKENGLILMTDVVKEKLSHAYTLDDECRMSSEITEVIDICNDTGDKHFMWFARLLENHHEGIIASCDLQDFLWQGGRGKQSHKDLEKKSLRLL